MSVKDQKSLRNNKPSENNDQDEGWGHLYSSFFILHSSLFILTFGTKPRLVARTLNNRSFAFLPSCNLFILLQAIVSFLSMKMTTVMFAETMTQAPKPILYVDVMLVIKLRFTGLVDSNE
jgi:hypothetical protein